MLRLLICFVEGTLFGVGSKRNHHPLVSSSFFWGGFPYFDTHAEPVSQPGPDEGLAAKWSEGTALGLRYRQQVLSLSISRSKAHAEVLSWSCPPPLQPCFDRFASRDPCLEPSHPDCISETKHAIPSAHGKDAMRRTKEAAGAQMEQRPTKTLIHTSTALTGGRKSLLSHHQMAACSNMGMCPNR